MSGVPKGSKRGPYAKRQDITDVSSLSKSTESVRTLYERLGFKTVVAMRRAVRKQKITADQYSLLSDYLNE